MSKMVQKFNEVKCNITTARVAGVKGFINKKHKGDLKEEMLSLVIKFGVFAIVSLCIYGIVKLGAAWANGEASSIFS